MQNQIENEETPYRKMIKKQKQEKKENFIPYLLQSLKIESIGKVKVILD